MGNNNTIDRYLGPRETEVIARLSYEKISVITREQFNRYFNFNKNLLNQIIYRLKRKGMLKTIKRGVYYYSPLESGPSGKNIDEFLIPVYLFPKGNYYIGYSTMYNFYGFTDQIFQVIYILNTSKQYDKVIGNINFKMLKISPKRMYGIGSISAVTTDTTKLVKVSDKERTLVDIIHYNSPVGGLETAFEIFEKKVKERVRNIKQINIKKLIKYATKFPIVSVRKRIGYLLEECGVSDKELLGLVKSIEKTSIMTLYDNKSRKGRINKKWRLIENAASE